MKRHVHTEKLTKTPRIIRVKLPFNIKTVAATKKIKGDVVRFLSHCPYCDGAYESEFNVKNLQHRVSACAHLKSKILNFTKGDPSLMLEFQAPNSLAERKKEYL